MGLGVGGQGFKTRTGLAGARKRTTGEGSGWGGDWERASGPRDRSEFGAARRGSQIRPSSLEERRKKKKEKKEITRKDS